MLIALGHRRYVGKDTAARFITNHVRLEHRGLQCQKISFATELKSTCYHLFKQYGLQPAVYYEQHTDEKDKILPAVGMSPRDIWIKVGNDIRAIHPLTWIDHALNGATAPVTIVADLRYLDEAKAIKDRGGKLIHIIRPDIPESDDVADSCLKDYTDWDFTIINRSLEELHSQIITIIDSLLKPVIKD